MMVSPSLKHVFFHEINLANALGLGFGPAAREHIAEFGVLGVVNSAEFIFEL
jgi:hypothetical protein